MENKKVKCSSKEHEEFEAFFYCQQCMIYLCKKCVNIHSKLCQDHIPYSLEKDIKDVFTGICKNKNHSLRLNYFCKTHNQLCCAQCITKIKDKDDGQHNNCEICTIENIKSVKKNKLQDNLKSLENFSKTLESSIDELKQLFQKMNENKENLKLEVQKIFTNLRNIMNEREDELLSQIDKKLDNLFFEESLMKECNDLPTKVKLSLENGNSISKDWENEKKLNYLINDCIKIENNISYINNMNGIINKCKSIQCKVKFSPEKDMKKLENNLKSFGKIYYSNLKFKKCPSNINVKRKYILKGKKNNILTKNGTDKNWIGTICENQLDKLKEYKWKITILKSKDNKIMVGVATTDFDINSSSYDNCGWYYNLKNSCYYSGPPHNYNQKKTDNSSINKISNNRKDRSNSSESKKSNKSKSSESKSSSKSKSISLKSKRSSKSKSSENKRSSKSRSYRSKRPSSSNSKNSYKSKRSRNSQKSNESKNSRESNSSESSKSNIIFNAGKEIILYLNNEEKILQFIIDNEEKGKYNDLPLDKPIVPAIFLYNRNDSVKIEEC